jgi:hypothetical protein
MIALASILKNISHACNSHFKAFSCICINCLVVAGIQIWPAGKSSNNALYEFYKTAIPGVEQHQKF